MRRHLVVATWRKSLGGPFDILSSQRDVDHHCVRNADPLLDQLDAELNVTEDECQDCKH